MIDTNLLSIDFDGVIHDHKNPIPGRKMGPPIKGAQEALIKFREDGYRIVVFCVWADTLLSIDIIKQWLQYYLIPFDEVTNIKQSAKFYIDDKAIRFINWADTIDFMNKNDEKSI